MELGGKLIYSLIQGLKFDAVPSQHLLVQNIDSNTRTICEIRSKLTRKAPDRKTDG